MARGLSVALGLPLNMVAGSQRYACQERESQAEAGILYDLTSNAVMQDHFCHIPFFRMSKKANPYFMREILFDFLFDKKGIKKFAELF